MLRTSMGQLLVNSALPDDMVDHNRTLDKRGSNALLRTLAEKHPEKYVEISKHLSDVGRIAATESGGYSFGLQHLRKSAAGKKHTAEIKAKVDRILNDDRLTPQQRRELIIKTVGKHQQRQIDEVYDEAVKAKNPLAMQVLSGSRGNKMNLSSLLASDMLYSDHRDDVIPLPVTSSYSQGLKPVEYWASTYGARKGTIASKFATADAGFWCLARGTLVRMGDFTVKPIEDILAGDTVLGANVAGLTFPVKVRATFANGARELHVFRFRYGKSRSKFVEITATEEHEALVRHIRRTRVRPDPVMRKTVTVSKTPLGKCEKRAVSSHSLVPPQGFDDTGYGVTESWAWMVGTLIGDGGLTTNHLGYSCADPELLELLTAELSAYEFTIKPKKNATCEYIISDRGPGYLNRLRTALFEFGLLGASAPYKTIPRQVSSWNNASVAALITGIFDTDGGVGESNLSTTPRLRLGMTAKAVIEGVQQLLAMRFGIYGQVCCCNVAGREITAIPGKTYCANHDLYELTVADLESVKRFSRLVGFRSPTKARDLQTLLAKAQEQDREADFVFHYVSSEAVGLGDTFDIEVDHRDHLFVLANGAVVSNSKQANQVSHRLLVTGEDDHRDLPHRGLPVDTSDPDNEGALLAADVGPYKRNTPITPKIASHIKDLGHDRILVRSPAVGGAPDGGLYARDVGVRERGTLPGRGEMIGMTAAQALAEPISQGNLSVKHSGGVAGQEKTMSGFQYISQLTQIPKTFKGGAAHSGHDGTVTEVKPAPAGGTHVFVDGKPHYVARGLAPKVKKGDLVEAGDVLSEGTPNPAEITKHKGIGEGRRYFTDAMRKAITDAGMTPNRRNIELMSRGLIDHVRMTDEHGAHVPDDVVPYSSLEHSYEPREAHRVLVPGQDALGTYLERPVLHYTIGTKVRPSVLKELQHFGVGEITVHKDPPPFEPEMIRAMDSLKHDQDWMVRQYGSGLKSGLLDAVHRGGTSDEEGTSFVPALARGVDFGKVGPVRQPEAGTKPPPEGEPFPVIHPQSVKPPAAPAKKKTGFLGLFKGSADVTAKPVSRIRQILLARPNKALAPPVRGTRLLKVAIDPTVDSTIKPVTGSSTTSTGGETINPAGQSGHVVQPPPLPHPTGNMYYRPTASAPVTGMGGQAPTEAQTAYPSQGQSAPPGQVHPDRLGNGYNRGLLQGDESPEMIRQFIAGGGNPGDPESGFGGSLGSAARLGSLFDAGAVGTLTGGRNAPAYGGTGNRDNLVGGRPHNEWGQVPEWVESVTRAAPPPTTQAVQPKPPAVLPSKSDMAGSVGLGTTTGAKVLSTLKGAPAALGPVAKLMAPLAVGLDAQNLAGQVHQTAQQTGKGYGEVTLQKGTEKAEQMRAGLHGDRGWGGVFGSLGQPVVAPVSTANAVVAGTTGAIGNAASAVGMTADNQDYRRKEIATEAARTGNVSLFGPAWQEANEFVKQRNANNGKYGPSLNAVMDSAAAYTQPAIDTAFRLMASRDAKARQRVEENRLKREGSGGLKNVGDLGKLGPYTYVPQPGPAWYEAARKLPPLPPAPPGVLGGLPTPQSDGSVRTGKPEADPFARPIQPERPDY